MDMAKCPWGILGRAMVSLVIPCDGYGQMSLRPFGRSNGPSIPHRFRVEYPIHIHMSLSVPSLRELYKEWCNHLGGGIHSYIYRVVLKIKWDKM